MAQLVGHIGEQLWGRWGGKYLLIKSECRDRPLAAEEKTDTKGQEALDGQDKMMSGSSPVFKPKRASAERPLAW